MIDDFFFTHSSAGEPLRGVGLVTGGGTEHLLITAGYMFLIRVPNSRSDTLITITFNSSTPHLSSRFRELSAEWVIYFLEFVVGIYHLAYEVPQSSVSLLRRKFDLHRNSEGGERNRTYAARNRFRFRATRSNLSATAAPCCHCTSQL